MHTKVDIREQKVVAINTNENNEGSKKGKRNIKTRRMNYMLNESVAVNKMTK